MSSQRYHHEPQATSHELQPSRHQTDPPGIKRTTSDSPRAHSGVVPPVPIPNTAVKHASADDTWTAGSWESRAVRGVFLLLPPKSQNQTPFMPLPHLGVVRIHCSRNPLFPNIFPRHPSESWGPGPSRMSGLVRCFAIVVVCLSPLIATASTGDGGCTGLE